MNQNNSHIHDIGFGKSGSEEIAGGLKKVIGVMAKEKIIKRQSELIRLKEGFHIGYSAGGVGGTIFAIGAAAENNDL